MKYDIIFMNYISRQLQKIVLLQDKRTIDAIPIWYSIHDELKDGNEMRVLEKYNYNGRRYTVAFTSKTIISIFYHIFRYILYISMLIYFPNLYIIKYIFKHI